MAFYKVISAGLNVRTTPSSDTNDNLFPPPLSINTVVEKVGESDDKRWAKVRITEGAITREGWVAARFLALTDAPAPVDDDGDQPVPAWLVIAEREIGVRETEPDNPRIQEYLSTATNLSRGQMMQDETDWCSAFVNWCLTQAGYTGTNHALARSWLNWTGGDKIAAPRYGAITVFKRLVNGVDTGKGHVAFFIKEDGTKIHVLGGNQNDGVNVKTYPKADLLAYIYPKPLAATDDVADEDDDSAPEDVGSVYRTLPNGRVYELSLDERRTRIAALEDALDDAETEAERAELQAQVDSAHRDFTQAQERAIYAAPVPPPHPSNVGGRTNWRRAWSWGTQTGGLFIIDPKAPYNDARVRNKPGEIQGSNIERVTGFLDVEHTDRYKPQGQNTFCTIYVCDATRILGCEIPIHPNRAANNMAVWLEGAEAKNNGWRAVATVEEAQSLANLGCVVLAIQRRSGAGHVALVRPVPADKPLLDNNAYIAQAGAITSSLTTVSAIFGDPDLVKYYMHP
ncbi:MAG: TIGR02594 family protein [Anaerolinea sp.]|nr:TIGR02594 family protein [Anaerolinea sp.]